MDTETLNYFSNMERYDYMSALVSDIKDYINENVDINDYEDAREAYDALYDDLWVEDSVTGNGSGSYTFNTWKAEENIAHNWDLVREMAEEFCVTDLANKGAEFIDVSIRCYLLGQALDEALEEFFD